MPGRTWIIAPDPQSLRDRWTHLIAEKDPVRKERLFHPHQGGDKHVNKMARESLAGVEHRSLSVAKDSNSVVTPIRYGFRSFDRQWLIPDNRLINRPNPTVWALHSLKQVYLTALTRHSPTSGPALTFTGLIPDLHHYKGSFGGRVFPMGLDATGTVSNIRPAILTVLSRACRRDVSGEDLVAYIAAVAAHPAYTARFRSDLVRPGLRIPLTAEPGLFFEAVDLGREVVWLHTFGERFAAPDSGRPSAPPRLPPEATPRIPKGGAIPSDADNLAYDPAARRLIIGGSGLVENVTPAMWAYEVSGKPVLSHWFSYRRRTRDRPIIGDRRAPSPLGAIQPDGWLAEYTTELLNLLNVLGRLAALEPLQARLLDRLCAGALLSSDLLKAAGAFDIPAGFAVREAGDSAQMTLLD
jgi:hypothetical protein